MASFNLVVLVGNLTRDPELKYTPKGTAMAQIGLAVNRAYKNEQGETIEETTFVDVDLWGRTAEIANEYLRKGSQVLINGRLKLDTWDDKQTGQKRSKLKVVGEELKMLGGKRDSGEGDQGESRAPQRPAQRQQSRQSAPPARRPQPPRDPDLDAPEDDIPF